MIAVDSSVIIAACASWHEDHRQAQQVMDRAPRLVGHCALEAFSVLTRLPAPQRVGPALVAEFLSETFRDEPLVLSAAAMGHLVGDLHQRGITGGAVYDGLVALSARTHGAELLSLDRRAAETYRRCGVTFQLL